MNNFTRLAWQQYEAGKDYKRRIGLYETIRKNERFYRGEQWKTGECVDLPHPVFNIVKRIIDYLICSVASAELSISYTDEDLSFITDDKTKAAIRHGIAVLNSNAAYRWEKSAMSAKLLRLLTDAAISGDGVIYCYWDADKETPHLFSGDIVTEIIDNVNLFVADVNLADIQAQDYIIISGRASVSSLRAEAAHFGASEEDIKKIIPDNDRDSQSGDMSLYELDGDDAAKATYIIKFWHEDGRVAFEKSVRDCVIKRAKTDCRLYPVALLNWTPTKNSFHGTSPITSLIPNQKFINLAYAMIMKHMTNTAFSKIIYDKSKIPEWSNEVGEAIGAMGGGNISDAVSVLGVGQLQEGYMELVGSAVELTKEMFGATESALGNIEANNTSAILALQETSRIPLEQVRSSLHRCVEDMANIWADMICAYYPNERLIPYIGENGEASEAVELSALKRGFLSARVDVTEVSRYTAASAQSMLDKLLDNGYITPASYVKRLPDGVIYDRPSLIEELNSKEKENL